MNRSAGAVDMPNRYRVRASAPHGMDVVEQEIWDPAKRHAIFVNSEKSSIVSWICRLRNDRQAVAGPQSLKLRLYRRVLPQGMPDSVHEEVAAGRAIWANHWLREDHNGISRSSTLGSNELLPWRSVIGR